MNFEQFAKDAGVTFIECDPEFGGKIGYKELDHPNCAVCGFRTEKEALNHWIRDKFGENTAKALLKLFKVVDKAKKRAA